MANNNSSILAALHTKIFVLHDEQKWSELETTAKELFKALGYPEDRSKEASEFVSDVYKYSDKAVESYGKKDYNGEREWYQKVAASIYLVHQSLGTETNSIPYKVRWYYAARHKKFISFTFNIFLSHLKRFKYIHPITSIKAAYVAACKIYPSHYRRSNHYLEEALKQYWDVILSATNKLPLPAEF